MSAVFDYHNELIRLHVPDYLGIAAEPSYLNLLNTIAFPKAELETHPMVTLITAATVDFVELRATAGGHTDVGTNAVTIGSLAPEFNLDPVIRIHCFVSQNRGPGPGIENNNVQIAVVI